MLLIAAILALATLGLRSAPPRVSVHRDTREQLGGDDVAAGAYAAQAGDADGLPPAWCGDEQTADDTAHAAWPRERPQIKVVYAYASDRPDRFALWSDALQADVAVVQRFLSAQSGGRKALRFDMGTRCGPRYADIQTVALPGPAGRYQDSLPAIKQDVQQALGDPGAPRDLIVLADGLASSDVEFGLGETIMGGSGEQPGAGNAHNRGGLAGMLFNRADDVPGAGAQGWWPEGFLHEITHTLGAVQWSAPHSTEPPGGDDPRYGHCWQGADVMCYAEDSGAAHALVTDCVPIGGLIPESYDCGRDDYYNPEPAPGSYLATHWNTYDSVFMAGCQEIAPACGGGELWVPEPPAATAAPVVSGRARRGATLTVSTGRWLNDPSGYRYRWQRLGRHGWRDVPRATRSRYAPGRADVGRRLRAMVIAINHDGASAATSARTPPVRAPRRARPRAACGTGCR